MTPHPPSASPPHQVQEDRPPRIVRLSAELANQIAAGEVVERPASVVKELVENALDAGASRIAVTVELGGKRLVRVEDDGAGMTADEALLALERHATSKIRRVEDLAAITSLGFRGEALPSIASVSRLLLRTRARGASRGVEVRVAGGAVESTREVGAAEGTVIEVTDLFYNVPARRKFLKTDGAESAQVSRLVTQLALGRHGVGFTLTSGARRLAQWPPVGSLKDRLFQLYKDRDDLVEVGKKAAGVTVTGFVAGLTGGAGGRARGPQNVFVNGRAVKDGTLAHAITHAYDAATIKERRPEVHLFIDLPPDRVDVNVHPTKAEVRFLERSLVHEVLRRAIGEALGTTAAPAVKLPGAAVGRAVPLAGGPAGAFAPSSAGAASPTGGAAGASASGVAGAASPTGGAAGAPAADPAGAASPTDGAGASAADPAGGWQPVSHRVPETVAGAPAGGALPGGGAGAAYGRPAAASGAPAGGAAPGGRAGAAYGRSAAAPGAAGAADAGRPTLADAVRELRPDAVRVDAAAGAPTVPAGGVVDRPMQPLGQLRDTFIIAVDEDGIAIIDQHVAHERVLFEQVMERLTAGRLESQGLLQPLVLDLPPAERQALAAHEAVLERLGFDVEAFGGDSVRIAAVPALVPLAASEAAVRGLAQDLDGLDGGAAVDEALRRSAATTACHAAVKAHDRLTHEKMVWILDALRRTAHSSVCPHGRPVVLRLSRREIEKRFERI